MQWGGGKGLTAFSRLFISELLPDVERVVYLDCDTLVRGSLKELFTMDLHGKPIAMAFNRYLSVCIIYIRSI